MSHTHHLNHAEQVVKRKEVYQVLATRKGGEHKVKTKYNKSSRAKNKLNLKREFH